MYNFIADNGGIHYSNGSNYPNDASKYSISKERNRRIYDLLITGSKTYHTIH